MFGRRGLSLRLWLLGMCLVAFAILGLIWWQYDQIQPRVLAAVGFEPTPTASGVELARRGSDAFWRGDLNTAVNNYREAANNAPRNIDIIYELARMLIYRSYGDVRNAGDIEEAKTWGAKAVQIAPTNFRAHAIYCYALVRDSKAEDAVRECLRAIELNRNDSEAHAFLSLAYYDLNRTSTAYQEGEEAVRLNDKSIDAHTAFAFPLWFQGQLSLALEHFKKAAEINPRLEFPYFNMGGFANAIAVKDPSKYLIAVNVYQTILSFNPNSVRAYTRLCQTYLGKAARSIEDARFARDNCEKAVELDPEYSPGWRWLGEVQYSSRNYEGALESFDQCYAREREMEPELRQEECWYLRAAAHFILGECPQAIPILEDVRVWADTKVAIEQTGILINKCADDAAYKGTYKTPTPIPTPLPRPTPIL
jgi:tetratricopeptide (TPR) repeat protein